MPDSNSDVSTDVKDNGNFANVITTNYSNYGTTNNIGITHSNINDDYIDAATSSPFDTSTTASTDVKIIFVTNFDFFLINILNLWWYKG